MTSNEPEPITRKEWQEELEKWKNLTREEIVSGLSREEISLLLGLTREKTYLFLRECVRSGKVLIRRGPKTTIIGTNAIVPFYVLKK